MALRVCCKALYWLGSGNCLIFGSHKVLRKFSPLLLKQSWVRESQEGQKAETYHILLRETETTRENTLKRIELLRLRKLLS